MKGFLAITLIALAIPANAMGATAQILGPNDNECIGGISEPVRATISGEWGATSRWEAALHRTDTGAVLDTWSGQTRTFYAAFDTTSLPVDVQLKVDLSVYADDGTATATHYFTPRYDRSPPFPAPNTSILAVSSRAAWPKWTYSRDYGCDGPQVKFNVGARDVATGGVTALAYQQPMPSGPSIGVLEIGHTYDVFTEAVDLNGLKTTGPFVRITTPTDLRTVLAGVVSSGGVGVAGIRVGNTMSYAGGRYLLPLGVGQETVNVQFGPCLVPFPGYCSPIQTVTDSVTTPAEVGLIQVKNRTVAP